MEVGEYVRTRNGIHKIYEFISSIDIDYIQIDERGTLINKNSVIKSSPDIIDILEVGDYVNGYKVDFTNIENKLTYEEKNIGFYDGDGDITLFENDIKSIVTKEQFKNMEYEVK